MFRIDAMSVADRDAVLAIDRTSFAASELGSGHDDPTAARARQLDEELARPWARLRVARSNPPGIDVLGYSLVWLVVDEVHLLNVAVRSAERRRGIGRALVGDVIAFARQKGATRILLEVRAGNRAALALYEGLGFVRFNVRACYYADGEDAVEMALALGDVPPGAATIA